METIAFFNLKGGVGKTTSAVNIAWHAANEGIPTLLWDLDPQGASSWLLKSKAKTKSDPKRFLSGKTPIGCAGSLPDRSIGTANHHVQRFRWFRSSVVKTD
ncbi:hypothetical protein LCGC14_2775890, partial [marine sediment metagenome]